MDVKQFYDALRKHFPYAPEWNNLSPQEQIQIVQGINAILSVVASERN